MDIAFPWGSGLDPLLPWWALPPPHSHPSSPPHPLCCRATVTTQAAQLPHGAATPEARAGSSPVVVPDSPPQASGPICLLRSKAGTWPTQNQSSQDDQENQQRPTPSSCIRRRQDQPLQEAEGLGPQDQESLSGCTLESVRGALNSIPPASQIIPDSLEGWGEVSLGGRNGLPSRPPHPTSSITISGGRRRKLTS